ncbi:translation initiation factor IF-2 [Polluticaenibacter yanchengensis]|uniref:Translation initiation factor IF-2 n=1 Tax=Polluticaenibacter yanchengensis TaxID=3014562 RepID=A0ABT4UHZ8_9BACT|nr:translation initiation factor IF-2 [Chitinophagaceae bacterium LY-5]
MSEIKLPRLLAAAKEFNIGQETLVDFLVGKGFVREDLKPSAKLSEPMYQALQKEFQSDKVAKAKSNMIDLPKGEKSDSRRKKEEEFRKQQQQVTDAEPAPATKAEDIDNAPLSNISVEEEVKPAKEIVVETPVVEKQTAPIENEIKPSIETKPAPPQEKEAPEQVAAPKEEKNITVEPVAAEVKAPVQPETVKPVETTVQETPKVTEKPVVKETPIEEKPVAEVKTSQEATPAKDEKPAEATKEEPVDTTVRLDAPGIEGPKVIGTIDLSSIDSSTRPRKQNNKDLQAPQKGTQQGQPNNKGQQNQPKPQAPQQQPAPKKEQADRKFEVKPKPEAEKPAQVQAPAPTPDEPPVIENIQAERISGPKILGKIELPVDSETRPKSNNNDREKRKRKRIPLDKRPVGGDANRPGGNNAGQQPRQGQGAPSQGGTQQRPTIQQPRREGSGVGKPILAGQPGHPGSGSGNRNDRRGGHNDRRGGDRNNTGNSREDKVIDEKEIQRKLQETQARLHGKQNSGKNVKARSRREKRRELAEAQSELDRDVKLQVTEFISVSELASLMDVSFTEVISKCMSLGMMVSINQRLDAEVIELVASEFDFEVEFIDMEKQAELEEEDEVDNPDDLEPRAPIVTIMGHVDHGKTSLLDYIRKANVVSGEAGGITQHIGAYDVTTASGKKVTFLDTPGHEAFTAMRARGAKLTDIAVIVIAADDAVMPQTKEAISHAQAANVPMIFAINKIDKDGANSQKIYEQLSQMNILVEEWGGKFQSQELSAKKGLNVDLLLEKILLEAELLDLKANPTKNASGAVVEASLDKGRGYVATVLVQDGTLKQGDLVVSGQNYGRVKAMFDYRNTKKTKAEPSTPVLILGLNGAPQAGEKFKVYQDEATAKEVANKRGQILREQGMRARKHITLDEIGRRLALGNFKELNVIIKGDVDGSVEALSDSLQKLSTEEIVVNVILKGVGAISENDVTLASASDAIIIGFNVRPNQQAARLAENEGIEIKQYSIIYSAIADIKSAMEGLLEPKIEEKEVANVEVREVYKFDKVTVAGCYVLSGKIKRDAKIRIYRDDALLYPRAEGAYAELGSLKRFKDDVKEVNNNYECGLTVKNYTDLQVGDIIVAFEEEEVKRTL